MDPFIFDVLTDKLALGTGGLVGAAVAMRRSPMWLRPPKEQKIRGLVIAWNTHDDDWGYQRCDEAHGEIDAR